MPKHLKIRSSRPNHGLLVFRQLPGGEWAAHGDAPKAKTGARETERPAAPFDELMKRGVKQGRETTRQNQGQEAEKKSQHEHLDRAAAKASPAETKEMNEKHVSHVEPFGNDPEKMVSPEHLNDFIGKRTNDVGQIWRLLALPRQMQYSLIRAKSEQQLNTLQCMFLRQHASELLRNHQMKKEWYDQRPAIQKVPVLTVPLKHRNVLKPTGKAVFMLGSALSGDIARDKDLQEGGVKYLPGSDRPENALGALQEVEPPADLDGATVAINFGSEMFLENASLEQLTRATDELLKFARGHNMKIVMGTPLHLSIMIGSHKAGFGNLSENEIKAGEDLRKKYTDYLAKQYQSGNLQAMVGLGTGMTRSHLTSPVGVSRVDELNYYKDSHDLSQGLTEEGTFHCASAMIDGINMANGETTGETSAGFELHRYGSGVAYDTETRRVVEDPAKARSMLEQRGRTIELIPDYEKRQSLSGLPMDVRNAIWSLCVFYDYTGLGGGINSVELEAHCQTAQEKIDVMPDGDQKTFAQNQFLLAKSSIYYNRAIGASFKGANAESLRLVKEAVEKNSDYLDTAGTDPEAKIFAVRLKQLRDDMENGVSYLGYERNEANQKKPADEPEERYTASDMMPPPPTVR